MKYIPNNLDSLELDLSNNKLGENIKGMHNLEKGMKYLPRNLKNFNLDLSMN